MLCYSALLAQTPEYDTPAAPSSGGAWARLEVENGDSVYVMSMRPFKVSAKRKFKDFDEQRQYFLYTRAAKKVYPFAVQAIAMYDDISQETADMKKRERKRYLRKEHRDMKADFEDQLKSLSKTEGKVLIKMIERELNEPFYDVIKDTRGNLTAAYWHNLGKIWGYDLRQGYSKGNDLLLDDVLIDYDFGHPDWWYY
ncbi:MAG: DUF4294 domain-containing protein [Lewinellaceae bacterium]|nr:DUF4294 domain-containing protein [Lewinellaceae bacterium]